MTIKIERTNLEDMTKEQLIELILETWEGEKLRETDLAGTEAALQMEGAEADKYAKLLNEADSACYHLLGCLTGKHSLSNEFKGLVNQAVDRHVKRLIAQEARKKN
jgi:hypothetical protein